MHNDDQDLFEVDFRDVKIGNPFQVIDEEGYTSDWVKITNSEAIGFDEVREFTLYEQAYIDMIRHEKDLDDKYKDDEDEDEDDGDDGDYPDDCPDVEVGVDKETCLNKP